MKAPLAATNSVADTYVDALGLPSQLLFVSASWIAPNASYPAWFSQVGFAASISRIRSSTAGRLQVPPLPIAMPETRRSHRHAEKLSLDG